MNFLYVLFSCNQNLYNFFNINILLYIYFLKLLYIEKRQDNKNNVFY